MSQILRGHSHCQVDPTWSSVFSELAPGYLEYVRVEHGRPPITVERYRARLQRFIDELGDCSVGEITPAKLSLYKRHLMDAGLGPVTIGGFLSCLRGFLRYLRDVEGLPVMDAEKIKRPRIPQRAVDYVTKEELDRLLGAMPTHTWKGLRDRALIEVLSQAGCGYRRSLASTSKEQLSSRLESTREKVRAGAPEAGRERPTE
jgi:integrase/recombinase XerD